jgi:hypothetical protein
LLPGNTTYRTNMELASGETKHISVISSFSSKSRVAIFFGRHELIWFQEEYYY